VGTLLAALVYSAGPRRPVNRWLALLLFLEAMVQAVCAGGLGNLTDDRAAAFGIAAVNTSLLMAIPVLYLVFLGVGLDTPLARPFRRRGLQVAMFAGLLFAEAYWLTHPAEFYAGMGRPWYAPWSALPGEGALRLGQLYAAVSGFALLATFDAYRRARTPSARGQAKLFALAFATRDAFWVVMMLYVVPFTRPGADVFWGLFWTQGMPAFMMAFVALLGYGILRAQLFDIELKVKWSVQQGVVAGAFATAFIVASQVVERLLDVQGVWFGLGAAVLVGLAFRPLERAAERLADRLMPGVRDTEEYRTVRKREVYRAAVESALQDGVITENERDVLATLAQQLGLGPAEARGIERVAMAPRPPPV